MIATSQRTLQESAERVRYLDENEVRIDAMANCIDKQLIVVSSNTKDNTVNTSEHNQLAERKSNSVTSTNLGGLQMIYLLSDVAIIKF